MITFDSASLEILYTAIAIAGIGALVTVCIERVLTWHGLKVKTIQKRNEEFIEFAKVYYMPLATILKAIENETDPEYEVRPKALFFLLAKYLSLFESMRDKGVWYVFPKYSQEVKIDNCSSLFREAINTIIFNDNKEASEHLIDYYSKKQNFLTFIKDVETIPDYTENFEPICNNKEITKKLYSHSKEFSDSIYAAVREAYKKWYKFEFMLFKKLHIKLIEWKAKKERRDILELNEKIHPKNSQ
jgi:hypothetical protein